MAAGIALLAQVDLAAARRGSAVLSARHDSNDATHASMARCALGQALPKTRRATGSPHSQTRQALTLRALLFTLQDGPSPARYAPARARGGALALEGRPSL